MIEAEGDWNGSVLAARTIAARRGRVEIEASVSSIGSGSVTLQLAPGTVTVQLDSRTLLEDDTDMTDNLTAADIRAGDFLEVEAVLVGNSLVATRIDRDEPDDDVVQAPVESFVARSSGSLPVARPNLGQRVSSARAWARVRRPARRT